MNDVRQGKDKKNSEDKLKVCHKMSKTVVHEEKGWKGVLGAQGRTGMPPDRRGGKQLIIHVYEGLKGGR